MTIAVTGAINSPATKAKIVIWPMILPIEISRLFNVGGILRGARSMTNVPCLSGCYPQAHHIDPGASRISSGSRLRDAEQGRAPSPVVGRFSQFNFADVFQAAVEQNLLRC